VSGLRTIRGESLRGAPARSDALRSEAAEAIGESEGLLPAVALPPGHPVWPRDLLSLTRRARDVLAALPRVIIEVLSFWDHPRREAMIAGSLVVIDAAGTYRVT